MRPSIIRYHPPEPQPLGKRGRKPAKGRRQRSVQAWASRSDTPWEDVEVAWLGGQRQQLWVVSPPRPVVHPWLAPGRQPLCADG
jgi:hypothetical protein